MLKEPLIHFLLIGGFLFFLHWLFNLDRKNPEDYTIYLDESDRDRLVGAYQKNWGKHPDSATLQQLIETEIKSEILYREALRMNLDHNDEIIRRRLKQKYEFLISDLNDQQKPSQAELKAFYEERINQYQHPETISFNQVYFSPDKRADPKRDAQQLLAKTKSEKLATDQIKSSGDPFHLPTFYSDRDHSSIRQLFGLAFADTLFCCSQTGWQGPFTSGYGQHLVQVTNITSASPRSFDREIEKITADWKRENLQVYNERLYQNLRAQYQIILDYQEKAGDD